MIDAATIARADANYFDAFRALAAAAADGEVIVGESPGRQHDGILIINTGSPLAMFNIAFVTHPLDDPAAAIAAAVAYFDERALPFVVRIRAGVDAAAERAAEALGLPYRDTVPGLVLNPIPAIPPPPPALDIRTALDAATLDDHLGILAEAFGMPKEIAGRLITPRTLDIAGAEFYVGYIDGAPVASSALIATDAVAGVWNVGCLPSHRRRGLGEAMTWHAVCRGVETGCDIANLQASEMGQPIYERMGFRPIAAYRTFVRAGF